MRVRLVLSFRIFLKRSLRLTVQQGVQCVDVFFIRVGLGMQQVLSGMRNLN